MADRAGTDYPHRLTMQAIKRGPGLARARRVAGVLSWVLASTAGCSRTSAEGAPDANDARAVEASASGASLSNLRVSTKADGPSRLVPEFSPDVYDYYVRCAAGTNALVVSMTAAPGALSSLELPASSPAAATQTLAVSVEESGAIVATATLKGSAASSYWVRCLPHDFPTIAVTRYPDAGTPLDGYYLLGNAVVSEGESGYAMIVNRDGVPVWYHPLSPGLAVTDVDNVVSGAVSFIPTSFVAYEPFEIHPITRDEAGPATELKPAPDNYTTDEHELQVLPNGHFLVFSYPFKSGVDLTGLAIAKPFDGGVLALGPDSTIQDCTVVEFDGAGKTYWQWSASDHFDPVADSTYPQTGFGPGSSLPDGGASYDVYHCNSIDVDPANGNLLVSARGMDSVFYIDRSSAAGTVLWKMGGSEASLDHSPYVSVADPFYRQHDARLMPGWSSTCRGGAGQISMLDDETGQPGPARGVVYSVVVGGGTDGGCEDASLPPLGASGRAVVSWQYKGTAVSGGGGSLREDSDGSRVVSWGISVPVFTEVDKNGTKLLELQFTAGDVSYRAVKVPLSAFRLEDLRSSAGK